jgi:fermentation-respiration switch protein FrsA (DUF1100 family)
MSLLLAILVAALLFLISVTLVIFLIGPSILLQPKRRRKEFYLSLHHPVAPSDVGLRYEEINVITNGGLRLNGWLIKAPPPVKGGSTSSPRGTILFLHGVGDCKIAGIPYAKLFYDHGFNTFLYDSRRHGESEGQYCTYGYYEKHDVIRVIDYLGSRSDIHLGNIGVFGSSMGAAVAIQTAALDKRIVAIAAENSFATLRSIFDDYQKRMIKLPFHYLRNIVIKRSELMANFKANDVSPLDAVARIHLPLLIIYSTNDRHIHPRYSTMLYDNTSEPKELYSVNGATHNDAWQVGGEEYRNKLVTFFTKNLT